MMLKKLQTKFNPPKKESNEIYSTFYNISPREYKVEMDKMSDSAANKLFKNHIHFGSRDLTAPMGIGSSSWNEITFDRVVRAIAIKAKENNWNTVMLGISDSEAKSYMLKLINKLREFGIESKVFRNPEALLPEISFAISKRNYDFGIYLDWNKSNMTVKLLGEKGRLLKLTEIEELDKVLSNTKYEFNPEKDVTDKINIIDDEVRIQYGELLRRNLKYINQGNIERPNSTIINTTSKLVYKKMSEIFKDQEWVYVHLSNKSERTAAYDISSMSSYKEAYFRTFKKKAKFIINIDGSGSRMSMAYKHNRTWKYETSNVTMLLILNKLRQDNLLRENDSLITTFNSSPALLDFAKKYKMNVSIKEDAFASTSDNDANFRNDIDYHYSVVPEINSPEAMVTSLLLISYLVNRTDKVSLTHELRTVSHKTHYTRRDTRRKTMKEYREDLRFIQQNKKISDLEVKNMSVVSDDEKTTIVKVAIPTGYMIQRYSKVNGMLDTVYHIFSSEQDEAFVNRKEFVKGHKSILGQDYKKDDSKVSSKTIFGLIASTILLVGVLWVIFTQLLDPVAIQAAFEAMGEKMHTPYPYLLIAMYPINRFLMPLIFMVVFNAMDVKVTYKQAFIGTFLAVFVSRVGLAWLMGPGMLVWYLRKHGHQTSQILAGTLITSVLFTLIQAVLSSYFVTVGSTWLYGMPNVSQNGLSSHAVANMAIGGWMYLLANMILQFSLAYSKKFHNFVNFWIEWGLFLFGRERNYREIHESMTFNFYNMRTSFKKVVTQPKNFLKVMAVWFPAWIFGMFESTFAINIVADVPMHNYWQTMTTGVMVRSATEFFGFVPGGNGTTEWVSISLFKGIVAGNLDHFGIDSLNDDAAITQAAQEIAFLDRFNVYVKTVVSGVFFLGFTVNHNIVKMRK